MQINFDNEQARFATSTYWYAPDLWNGIQDVLVPPIYAPYGTPGFWPPETAPQITNVPDKSIAPNSASQTTVARAAAVSGIGDAPPAASPGTAAASGAPIGPSTLVAPMPTITPLPASQISSPPAVACTNPINDWVNNNPMLAALGAVAVYLLFGGHK